jgi:hypothetical protein
MKRLQSILCVSLLALTLSSSAFAGEITGRAGEITGKPGEITGKAGEITGRPGEITGKAGEITGGLITTILGLMGILP